MMMVGITMMMMMTMVVTKHHYRKKQGSLRGHLTVSVLQKQQVPPDSDSTSVFSRNTWTVSVCVFQVGIRWRSRYQSRKQS